MTFKIGQRVSVTPMSEQEAEHEIVGAIVEVLGNGYAGSNQDWYVVVLDQYLYGMDHGQEPNIDVPENELALI